MFSFAPFLTRGLLELLAPPVCFLCGKPTHRGRRALCWACLNGPLLRADVLSCAICGGQSPAPGRDCAACEKNRPAFFQARAAVVFAGDVRRLVHLFKYRGALWLRGDFGDWLHGCFTAHYSNAVFDCVVPVPVTRMKFFQRHYNQSERLARELGRRVSLPVVDNALARRGGSETQTALTRHGRGENVARAFYTARPNKIKDKDVLLVDDILTTGATANACTRALLRAGAQSVRVITVARGVME